LRTCCGLGVRIRFFSPIVTKNEQASLPILRISFP
jgi:hypothetical protein